MPASKTILLHIVAPDKPLATQTTPAAYLLDLGLRRYGGGAGLAKISGHRIFGQHIGDRLSDHLEPRRRQPLG